MKRIYFFLLCICLGSLPLFADDMSDARDKADFREQGRQMNDSLYYKILGGDSVALVSAGTDLDSLEIPAYATSIGTVYRVTAIADSAFYNVGYLRTRLTKIILPKTINSIGTHAFVGYTNLTELHLNAANPPELGNGAFLGMGNAILYVPCACAYRYTASGYKDYFADISSQGNYFVQDSIMICQGEMYDWRGRYITESGVYYDSLMTMDGCDSVHVLHLTVHENYVKTLSVQECDSFVWHDRTYKTSGIYSDTMTTVYGCDSVEYLELEIHSSYAMYQIIDIPMEDTVVLSDGKMLPLGMTTFTYKSAFGCDSTWYYAVVANPNVKNGESEVAEITTTTATLKWQPDTAVTHYEIKVYTDSVLFAQYMVDGKGQILSSQRFAPSIYHQEKDSTQSSTDYFVITLDGLSAGTDYGYTIQGMNASNEVVYHEQGAFTTKNESEQGIEEAPSDQVPSTKVLRDGMLYIIRPDGKTYTLQGTRIED